MRLALALAALLLPGAAHAGVYEAVLYGIQSRLSTFWAATEGLSARAEETCDPAALDGVYQLAWGAWGRLADVRLGPFETAALSIAFWPDERGAGARVLTSLIAAADPAALPPEAYAQQSVAARGLTALDLLLHGDFAADVAAGGYACDLMRAVAADLAAQAETLLKAWPAEAMALMDAGEPGNARYMTEDEAFRAIYTQVLSGLEFTADSRLGRPLGEFDRPRPMRAEAWRSGRPLRGVIASAEGAARLAQLLAGTDLPATDAALDAVHRAGEAVADPSFQDIADPTARLKLEILQQRVRALADAIEAELGAPRGISPGFNSQDGD